MSLTALLRRTPTHTGAPGRPTWRALVLALAVLATQALGLWHAIVHHEHGHPAARFDAVAPAHGAAAQAPAASTQAPSGFFQRLFDTHEDDSDCQLFDLVSHADAALAQVLALQPGTPPARAQARAGERRCTSAPAAYLARAPPALRLNSH